jgi:hypothetical protein
MVRRTRHTIEAQCAVFKSSLWITAIEATDSAARMPCCGAAILVY